MYRAQSAARRYNTNLSLDTVRQQGPICMNEINPHVHLSLSRFTLSFYKSPRLVWNRPMVHYSIPRTPPGSDETSPSTCSLSSALGQIDPRSTLPPHTGQPFYRFPPATPSAARGTSRSTVQSTRSHRVQPAHHRSPPRPRGTGTLAIRLSVPPRGRRCKGSVSSLVGHAPRRLTRTGRPATWRGIANLCSACCQ